LLLPTPWKKSGFFPEWYCCLLFRCAIATVDSQNKKKKYINILLIRNVEFLVQNVWHDPWRFWDWALNLVLTAKCPNTTTDTSFGGTIVVDLTTVSGNSHYEKPVPECMSHCGKNNRIEGLHLNLTP
jgi:hypothetical protein